jgi:hypothetical protein
MLNSESFDTHEVHIVGKQFWVFTFKITQQVVKWPTMKRLLSQKHFFSSVLSKGNKFFWKMFWKVKGQPTLVNNTWIITQNYF